MEKTIANGKISRCDCCGKTIHAGEAVWAKPAKPGCGNAGTQKGQAIAYYCDYCHKTRNIPGNRATTSGRGKQGGGCKFRYKLFATAGAEYLRGQNYGIASQNKVGAWIVSPVFSSGSGVNRFWATARKNGCRWEKVEFTLYLENPESYINRLQKWKFLQKITATENSLSFSVDACDVSNYAALEFARTVCDNKVSDADAEKLATKYAAGKGPSQIRALKAGRV